MQPRDIASAPNSSWPCAIITDISVLPGGQTAAAVLQGSVGQHSLLHGFSAWLSREKKPLGSQLQPQNMLEQPPPAGSGPQGAICQLKIAGVLCASNRAIPAQHAPCASGCRNSDRGASSTLWELPHTGKIPNRGWGLSLFSLCSDRGGGTR